MSLVKQFKLAALTMGVAILGMTSCKQDNDSAPKERKLYDVELSENGVHIDHYGSGVFVKRYTVNDQLDSAVWTETALLNEAGEPEEFTPVEDTESFALQGPLKENVLQTVNRAETAAGQADLQEDGKITLTVNEPIMSKKEFYQQQKGPVKTVPSSGL